MGTNTAVSGVTVVIPTHNRADMLEITLASVLAQVDVRFEVVVVDDGSDLHRRPARGLDDPRVRVVRHPVSRGVAASRNSGLAAASMPWVAFTDDDDLWAPEKLVAQLMALQASPDARWSCVGAVHCDDDLRLIGHGQTPPPGDVSDLLLVRNRIPGGGSGVLAETVLVRELGGFDEALSNSADSDMWIRLGLAAPLAPVARPLLGYRVHGSGMSRQLDDIYREIGHVRAKYRAERAARGITPGETVNVWIGDRHQRSGRRLQAARAYARAAPAIGVLLAGARAAEALVWPAAIHRRDVRRVRLIPTAWLTEAEGWLQPIRDDVARRSLEAPQRAGESARLTSHASRS